MTKNRYIRSVKHDYAHSKPQDLAIIYRALLSNHKDNRPITSSVVIALVIIALRRGYHPTIIKWLKSEMCWHLGFDSVNTDCHTICTRWLEWLVEEQERKGK